MLRLLIITTVHDHVHFIPDIDPNIKADMNSGVNNSVIATELTWMEGSDWFPPRVTCWSTQGERDEVIIANKENLKKRKENGAIVNSDDWLKHENLCAKPACSLLARRPAQGYGLALKQNLRQLRV